MRTPALIVAATGLIVVAPLAVAADRRVEGVVRAVDAEKFTITLATKAGAAEKTETLDVLKKAKVTVNARAATLNEVRRGQKAVVVVNSELDVATKIDATGEGVATLVPEITVVKELPDPDGQHTGPWVSPDGLTLFWKSQPGAAGSAWIWSARRASKDAFFEDAKRQVPGSDMTLTADGLEMILLQGDSLWVTTRPSIEAAFVRPRKIAEFQGQGFLSVPCLSGNDLVLYADRFGPDQPVAPVKSTRASRRAKWGVPTPVKLALPAGKRVRFFSVTPDGSRAFCLLFDWTPQQPSRPFTSVRNELVTMRAEGDGFGRPEVIRVDGEPLQGIFPRYVAATNELFFVPTAKEGTKAEIAIIRNFDPDTIEKGPVAAAPRPTRPDREAIQGRWVSISEEVSGKPFTREQIQGMNKRLEVRGDRFIIRRIGLGGKFGVYDGTFRLTPSAYPRTFDWSGQGPEGATEMRGIYELDGDKLRLCYVLSASGAPRPTELLSTAGSKRLLIVFKREKP